MALAIVMVGCEGKSERHGSDDGDNGGSAGTGGAAGGTAGTDAGATGAALDCNGFCSELSRCTDVSPQGCVSSCEWAETETRALGCFPEYQAVHDCFVANGLCGFSEDACSEEMTTYALCASGSGSSICKTACQREAVCRDLFPDNCLVSCGKDARLAGDLGCSAEHDAYVTCSTTHPDPCQFTSMGCAAEDEALLQCALR